MDIIKHIAATIDHTLLSPTAKPAQFIDEAKYSLETGVASFCLRPDMVSTIAKQFPSLRLCTVVGFPHGANTLSVKTDEIQDAVTNGAREIDIVLSLSNIADENWDETEHEIASHALLTESLGVCCKLIFETGYWEEHQIAKLCQIASKYKIDFVKTSTGFAYLHQNNQLIASGATEIAIKIMKQNISGKTAIKASGGIRSYEKFKLMHDLGATRIGSSATRLILDEAQKAIQ